MKGILIIVSFICCAITICGAQKYQYYQWPSSAEVIQLKSELQNTDDDFQKMELCRSIAMYYWHNSKDSAILYSQKQLTYAIATHQPLWQAEAHKNLAFLYQYMIEYTKAFSHAQQGLDIMTSDTDKGTIFKLSTFANDLSPSTAHKRVLANLILSLSIINRRTGNLEQSHSQLDRARHLALEIHDLPLLADIGISQAFKFYYSEAPQKIDSAITVLQSALQYVDESNFRRVEYHIFGLLGQIYYQSLDLDSVAQIYLNQSLASAIKHHNWVGVGFSNLFLAQYHHHIGNIDSSLVFAQQSLRTFLSINEPNNRRRVYRFLINSYEESNNIDSTYKYQSLLLSTNQLLNQDQKIRDLQKALFSKEIDLIAQASEEKNSKAKAKINALLIGGCIILISAFFLYRNNRQKQKLNARLKRQKTALDGSLEALRTAQSQLKESDAQKNVFLTNITHEFRTPLTVIEGMSHTALTDIKQKNYGDIDQALRLILRNSDYLLRLVNRLLDLTKLQYGHMSLQLRQADIIPYIKYLCESFESLAAQSEITIQVSSNVKSLTMDFDAEKVSTLMSNLLSNAIKFTSASGQIQINLDLENEPDNEILSIAVRDSGLGISEENISKIFDRFYQVDGASSQAGHGTGIGLALTAELVKLMNGEISVRSKLNHGSTFTIELPVRQTADKNGDLNYYNKVESASYSSHIAMPFLSSRVSKNSLPLALIIEDNLDVAHYLKKCLEGKYDTLHAVNGKVGIKIAQDKIPDVVISDVMMPEKDGFEVCATLKRGQLTDHIPIVLLTAKVTSSDRLKGLAFGADAYLSKPFLEAELLTRLEQLVLLRKKLIHKFKNKHLNINSRDNNESASVRFIDIALQIAHQNLTNPNFNVVQFAQLLKCSESQTYRKIKAETGLSTIAFINQIRLQKAKERLQSSKESIAEIAFQTGFEDPAYFSRVFKEAFGMTPNALRKVKTNDQTGL